MNFVRNSTITCRVSETANEIEFNASERATMRAKQQLCKTVEIRSSFLLLKYTTKIDT